MDIYQSRYFIWAWRHTYVTGIWPWQGWTKYLFRFLFFVSFTVFNIPMAISALHTNNRIIFMENSLIILLQIACSMKVFAMILAQKQVKELYEDIAENWKTIQEPNEKKILIEHSVFGRKLMLAYIVFYYLAYVVFIVPPTFPIILNLVNPLPKPRPYFYTMNGEYLVENKDLYYVFIYFGEAALIACVLTSGLSADPMYAGCVEQCVALYDIIKYRLSLLKKIMVEDEDEEEINEDASYDWLLDTIKLHQKTIAFTSVLESSYSFCFLVVIVINLLTIPVSCVLFLASFNAGNWPNAIRYAILFATLSIHLFNLFWPSQRLTDSSAHLFTDTYTNEWYETPGRTKKLLRFMMLKCLKPAELTAGGIILMSLENYMAIMKVAISYITVFASFQ